MLKYKVTIRYYDFIFDYGRDALEFAETAALRSAEPDKEKVDIRFYYEEPEEEVSDDDNGTDQA
ncbi:MAG: hypothetical protein II444_04770 [Firmicutes bacterium]|nr:hypothetical protein [Bacillota bacterium]